MSVKKYIYLTSFLLVLILAIFCFPSPGFAIQNQKGLLNLSVKEIVDIVVSSLGTSFALFTLWRGVEQYRKEQKWKKAEFVAKEMKEFKSDPVVKKVMLMLDWNQRNIQLSDGSDNVETIFSIDSELCKALQSKTYLNEKGGFTHCQSLIRDHFDVFFDYLERFEVFIEVRLVTEEDFRPYLNYWLNLIGNRDSGRKSQDFYTILWEYIDFFGYEKVQKLMSRYGYCIKL